MNSILKPVHILSEDGGPDENPRYPKVIAHGVECFRKHDLDALFVITNAPGRSAFNRVERRMAPLSRKLSGVILPHDHFGSHLNSAGKTVDSDLEFINFQYAGKVLTEIWNNVKIDDHPVIAQYATAECVLPLPEMPSSKWYSTHVRESQYFLQVGLCRNYTIIYHHIYGIPNKNKSFLF